MQHMVVKKFVGFPDLKHAEFQATRPMTYSELPRLVRIEHELATITTHHERMALYCVVHGYDGHAATCDMITRVLIDGEVIQHTTDGLRANVSVRSTAKRASHSMD